MKKYLSILFLLLIFVFVSCDSDGNINLNNEIENYNSNSSKINENEYMVSDFPCCNYCIGVDCTLDYYESRVFENPDVKDTITSLNWYGPSGTGLVNIVTKDKKFNVQFFSNLPMPDIINLKTQGSMKINGTDCSNKEFVQVENIFNSENYYGFNIEIEDNSYVEVLSIISDDITYKFADLSENNFTDGPHCLNIYLIEEMFEFDQDENLVLNEIPNVTYQKVDGYGTYDGSYTVSKPEFTDVIDVSINYIYDNGINYLKCIRRFLRIYGEYVYKSATYYIL